MISLQLDAVSKAQEAGFLAMRDIATVAAGSGVDYRLVGGQMVTLHVAAAGIEDPSLRQTLDADLGVRPRVAADPAIVEALRELDYDRPNANRFERTTESGHDLAIDLLTPAYGSRMITNQQLGDMFVDAIPGLSLALARPGEDLDLAVRFMDDTAIRFRVVVPDIFAALCVKVTGWADRSADKDALDVWRLLRAYRARLPDPPVFNSTGVQGDTAAILQRDFAVPSGDGMRRATSVRAEQAEIRALALHALTGWVDPAS